jgi:hypothetical protein
LASLASFATKTQNSKKRIELEYTYHFLVWTIFIIPSVLLTINSVLHLFSIFIHSLFYITIMSSDSSEATLLRRRRIAKASESPGIGSVSISSGSDSDGSIEYTESIDPVNAECELEEVMQEISKPVFDNTFDPLKCSTPLYSVSLSDFFLSTVALTCSMFLFLSAQSCRKSSRSSTRCESALFASAAIGAIGSAAFFGVFRFAMPRIKWLCFIHEMLSGVAALCAMPMLGAAFVLDVLPGVDTGNLWIACGAIVVVGIVTSTVRIPGLSKDILAPLTGLPGIISILYRSYLIIRTAADSLHHMSPRTDVFVIFFKMGAYMLPALLAQFGLVAFVGLGIVVGSKGHIQVGPNSKVLRVDVFHYGIGLAILSLYFSLTSVLKL